ncbi:MAG TPA: PEP/pyruvate-binding domain-containing protein [Caldisericia bacterium]|nr:PEP/pyruvate-binding domain-containing protein [Caldisericia bacterium]HPF48714.1 PEP/pyruvate-binding domain-containing protein [Caldisericia bacterium]HPI83626.1 PEP/pyruvate-binding domain-containing protein [Caldisericia bacterium]HPQ93169.1 PEP/pyruvate-binding domain-containing protein [Caldisericia bacterium]HRV74998.1 PEP/pyruvate-binding domain-containing protein [Caldisericia bacterium]
MKLVVSLADATELSQFGGKGANLAKLIGYDMNVPGGIAVSTVAYKEHLKTNNLGGEITNILKSVDFSSKSSLDETSNKIKQAITTANASDELISEIEKELRGFDGAFAVRSSATAEDLPDMSFAGLQDTYLNVVGTDNIIAAVKACWASLWNTRAISYRHKNNLGHSDVLISVVIQQMVAPQASGVSFSINPVNNDFDDVVINSNFGLGESVVSGRITPDSFTVSKIDYKITERKISKKDFEIRPKAGGGVEEIQLEDSSKSSLSDAQVVDIARTTVEIEKHFGVPVDVEWAIAENKTYILQARPVTTYVPVPESLQTKPGRPRRVYLDFMLTRQGVEKNFTVLGLEFWDKFQRPYLKEIMGFVEDDPETKYTLLADGRGYINFGSMIALYGRAILKSWGRVADSITGDIMKQILDSGEYIPEAHVLKKLRRKLLRYKLNMVRLMSKYFSAYNKPDKYLERVRVLEDKLTESIENLPDEITSLNDYSNKLADIAMRYLADSVWLTYAAERARFKLDEIFKGDGLDEVVNSLGRSLPGNITVEMGLSMHSLSQFDEIKNSNSFEDFSKRLGSGNISNEFREAWDDFLEKFGFRASSEIDAGALRTYERLDELYDKLVTMSKVPAEQSPVEIQKRSIEAREEAYRRLLDVAKRKHRIKTFRKNYDIQMKIGGYRETHKYYIVKIIDTFRRKALDVAKRFVEQGLLDDTYSIFNLTIPQIDAALSGEKIDLRKLAWENSEYMRRTAHVKRFPRMIDSRGKILQPKPKTTDENTLVGEQISPGRVVGAVKVLSSPNEKPVLPGEILVARATDPGWTPLFVNASGIVLEVGGMLQHGACVAREYGKPCVAGVMDATIILQDGQTVEVDGSAGTVRIIKE